MPFDKHCKPKEDKKKKNIIETFWDDRAPGIVYASKSSSSIIGYSLCK